MIYTFKDLQDRVLRHLDETASGSPTTLALVKDFLNTAHQLRCQEFPWAFMLWPREVTFSTVSGTRLYALHEEFGRPLYFRNQTTTQYLEEIPARGLPENGRDWTQDTSDAQHFFFAGQGAVSVQPGSSGAVVTIVSSSAADTASAQAITIYGENASGHVVSEALTPSGTTPVVGTTTFYAISDVVKSTSWAGTLTLSVGAATGLTLLPTQLAKQYRLIHFVESPAAAQTIGYRFYRKVRPLEADGDIPLIPGPWSDLLVWDALVLLGGYLTETNPQTLGVWIQKQREARESLYQGLGIEGQSLEARPQYVRYMDANWDDPRIR